MSKHPDGRHDARKRIPTIDHLQTSPGPLVRNRDPPKRDFVPKKFTKKPKRSDQKQLATALAALGSERRFLSAAPCLLLGCNSEVSAGREFFAV
jgi:hypothetical protein